MDADVAVVGAATRWAGYMDGAVESGHRAAQECLTD
ncbi:FAD-dependent oxidoreductase [Nonomuraea sp. NPDC050536]